MTNPIEPGSPDAVHLAYRGDTAGICGRPTGVLTSDPGDYDCPECDAMYVGIMNADSEREYLALRDFARGDLVRAKNWGDTAFEVVGHVWQRGLVSVRDTEGGTLTGDVPPEWLTRATAPTPQAEAGEGGR